MEKEKKLYEALDLGKDCIVIPRQAIGKLVDNDILGPIFSILPLFYEEDRKDTIILTLKDMINHLLITDNLFILNLIINGLPSIWNSNERSNNSLWSFKPYYKWITFNIYRGT